MRLCHFSFSVNSFFKHACAAIQWGQMSDLWLDPLSTFILHVCEQRRLWRDCADAPSPESSLVAYVISTIISCAGQSSIPTSGTFFRGDLVMKTFLRPFSLFRSFKKSSCQLLAKKIVLNTGKPPRRLAQEQCG